jgi:alpha-L-fucosidase
MSPAKQDDRLRWYLEAKFGLFLHWGPYSVAGVEASWPIMAPELAAAAFGPQPPITEAEYVALPQRFNPTEFDPVAWAHLARQAGMRYIIFTAKHHDGFCMFDAPGTSYKITNTPYGRDVCAELADACAQVGIRLGFYYSQPDMHHPGYRDTTRPVTENWLGEPQRPAWSGYLDYLEEHLRTLLTNYGPVSVLWFDGIASHEKYDPARFHRLIDELSPQTLINDRLGGRYDFVTLEQFLPTLGVPVKQDKRQVLKDRHFRLLNKLLRVPGIEPLLLKQARRYAQGQLQLGQIPTAPYPALEESQPWETCMTMNDTWAYNPAGQAAYKPAGQLVCNLVEAASRGGNYLLNVGPTPLGTCPPEAVDRLRQIGEWMAANSEAIHGTTYGPLQLWGPARSTARDGILYLHVLDWPKQGQLQMNWFPGQVASVSLLADGRDLAFEQAPASRLTVQVPYHPPDPWASVLVVQTKP